MIWFKLIKLKWKLSKAKRMQTALAQLGHMEKISWKKNRTKDQAFIGLWNANSEEIKSIEEQINLIQN